MLERTRNTVGRRHYEVLRGDCVKPVGQFRRLRDASHEACVRARFDRAGAEWLVIQVRRGRPVQIMRRVQGGPGDGESTGDRFPRRPLRPLGAGSVALPLPE
jgi:hypothetical protein